MRVNNLSMHSESGMKSTESSQAKHVPLGVDVKSALFMLPSNHYLNNLPSRIKNVSQAAIFVV